jgi:hypothetical protein
MRFTIGPALLVAMATASCAARRTPVRHVAGDARGLEGLAWLAGRWVSRTNDQLAEETWTAPSGHAMQGIGRVVRADRTVFFEFMTIEERDGSVVFTAWPNGHPPTTFTLDRASRGEAVFVNPSHDFPSRIVYRLEADGHLFTRAEGAEDGRAIADDTRFESGQ